MRGRESPRASLPSFSNKLNLRGYHSKSSKSKNITWKEKTENDELIENEPSMNIVESVGSRLKRNRAAASQQNARAKGKTDLLAYCSSSHASWWWIGSPYIRSKF